MKLVGFRICVYRSVLDSGWIDIDQMAVLVGKNESGKTTLLKALHKFNPFSPEPYSMNRDWPRGRRRERSDAQIVCTCNFEPTPEELEALAQITDKEIGTPTLQVTKDYAGRFEVQFPDDLFPDRLHPNDVDTICESLPPVPDDVADEFHKEADSVTKETIRLAHEGRFSELVESKDRQAASMSDVYTAGDGKPETKQKQTEEHFVI